MPAPARAHVQGRRARRQAPRSHAGPPGARVSTAAAPFCLQLQRSTSRPPFAVPPRPGGPLQKHRSRREAAASSGHNPSRRLFQQRKVPTLLEQVRGHGHFISPRRWRCQRSLRYRRAHERFPLDGRALVAAQHRPQAGRPRRPPARRHLSDQRRQERGAAADGVGAADAASGDAAQRAGQSRCRRAGGAAAAPGLRACIGRRATRASP